MCLRDKVAAMGNSPSNSPRASQRAKSSRVSGIGGARKEKSKSQMVNEKKCALPPLVIARDKSAPVATANSKRSQQSDEPSVSLSLESSRLKSLARNKRSHKGDLLSSSAAAAREKQADLGQQDVAIQFGSVELNRKVGLEETPAEPAGGRDERPNGRGKGQTTMRRNDAIEHNSIIADPGADLKGSVANESVAQININYAKRQDNEMNLRSLQQTSDLNWSSDDKSGAYNQQVDSVSPRAPISKANNANVSPAMRRSFSKIVSDSLFRRSRSPGNSAPTRSLTQADTPTVTPSQNSGPEEPQTSQNLEKLPSSGQNTHYFFRSLAPSSQQLEREKQPTSNQFNQSFNFLSKLNQFERNNCDCLQHFAASGANLQRDQFERVRAWIQTQQFSLETQVEEKAPSERQDGHNAAQNDHQSTTSILALKVSSFMRLFQNPYVSLFFCICL